MEQKRTTSPGFSNELMDRNGLVDMTRTVPCHAVKSYKDLTYYALKHINESHIWKQVDRQATHQHIDNVKESEKQRFALLG